jgi:GNAT superfamily N-acetyltransferase
MASIDTDPDITVGYSRLSSNAVWCFFDEIDDVPTLTAIEEQGEAWEALLDGDRLGMAVVDTVEMPFVSRLAVTSIARRIGVATAILDRLQDEYSRPHCRVHKENLAGIRLIESTAFHRKQEGHHSELRWYDIQVNDVGGRPTRHGERHYRSILNVRFNGVPIRR